MSEYPTDAQLVRIEKWPHADLEGCFAFVRSLWWCEESLWREPSPGVYEVSTGGWSGNESLIAAMRDNVMLWMIAWQSSHRGGHYKFGLDRGVK